MSIVPKNADCKLSSCNLDLNNLNEICLDPLKNHNETGVINGCLSPCDRFNNDQTCCPFKSSNIDECDYDKLNDEYATIFKKYCPSAGIFKNNTEMRNCHSNEYNVRFC